MTIDPTDEELNARAAETLGWKMHDHPDCLALKQGWVSRDWKTWVLRPDGCLVMFTEIPNFCGSADAALELVEAMRSKGWRWVCYGGCGTNIEFYFHKPGSPDAKSEAPTFPLAIVRAVLAAQEKQP